MKLSLKNEDREKLDQVRRLLEKDPRVHYTNIELAQKVGTNEFKLKNGFKQLYLMSPFEYLTNLRIEKAKELLSFTQHPIKRVAVEVGFTKSTNFSKRFRILTGVTPLEWRNNYQKARP